MKNFIKIGIYLLIVAALAVAIYFVVKQPSLPAEEESVTKEPQLTVRTIDEKITHMTLTNAEGSFEFAESNGDWVSLFREGEPTYGNTVTALYGMLKTTLAVELIEENTASLSKYGLDEPKATLSGIGESGNVYYIQIGNSIVGSKYYFTVDGNRVYTMSADEGGLYFVGMGAFVRLSLTSLAIEDVLSVAISNGNLIGIAKKNVSAADNTADALFTYAVTSPISANASPTATQSLFEKMASVGAKSFLPYPDAEETAIDAEKYFSVTTAEKTETFYIGAKTGSGYYVQKQGEAGVYIVDGDVLSFMDTKLFDIVDKHISLYYLNEVSSVDITSPEGNYSIVLGDSPTVNGNAANAEAVADFYERLISLCYDASLSEEIEVSAAPEITISFNTSYGVDRAEFYAVDVMNYEVRKNNLFGLTVQKKYLEKILKLAKEL